MSETFPLQQPLPNDARPAIEIAARLADAGHVALLAGGCVRDLLLGDGPHDYDVATDAAPDRVCRLFKATRKVGAQFGVVLVRQRKRWVEVATFRSEGRYSDGRHPDQVTFGDARQDALRRDFTVNGMFLDPRANVVIDYVGGREDLAKRLIRAIGEPAARFEEDHLRLLRAVRFAARLAFEIEPQTRTAIGQAAPKLLRVSAERIREELERMLAHPARARAFEMLAATRLLPHLWPSAEWRSEEVDAITGRLRLLSADVAFEPAFAALIAGRPTDEIDRICRALTFSNDQREDVLWLVQHQGDMDDADAIGLAALKRLMAHRAFGALRQLVEARFAGLPEQAARAEKLGRRLAAIPPQAVQPPPFITGDDLAARHVPPGPIYKRILDDLYTRQLDEIVGSREEALAALARLL